MLLEANSLDWLTSGSRLKRGDLIVCIVQNTEGGAYTSFESVDGTRPLSKGQTAICVMGDRQSGRNILGALPLTPVVPGAALDLLAIAGLAGTATFVPPHLGQRAVSLEYVAQLVDSFGRVLNVENFPRLARRTWPEAAPVVLVVCGSSAEVGKTTLVERLIGHARAKGVRCGAVKLTGTGRRSDVRRYSAAGAVWAADFVDVGFASTYSLSAEEHSIIHTTLVSHSHEHGIELLIAELGGDLLEGGVPEAVKHLGPLGATFCYLASDAMAAKGGLAELHSLGVETVELATRQQNKVAFADRLGLSPIRDVDIPEDLIAILNRVFD